MSIHRLISSFNSGELSPLLDARANVEKYDAGCRRMENMVPLTYGPAFRRPGMHYLGEAKNADKECRLVGFAFSVTTTFVLEFGDLYLRFWSNDALVESGGSPVEVTTPYLEADLFELQFAQINDVMYITHPDYAVRKLSRVSDTSWTFETVEWDWPALLDENITTTTLAAGATTGTGVALVASADLFDADHVGAYFEIAHRRENAYARVVIDTNELTSSTLRTLGAWEVTTYGTWDATVHLDRSRDGGSNWETLRSWSAVGERNIVASGNEESEVLLRLRVADWTSSTDAYAILELADSRIYGVVQVTAVTDAQNAVVDVVSDLQATTATSTWSEGAWSDYQGHPTSVTLHEQRLVFGGTTRQPQRFWGSTVSDFQNFRRTTLDDGSYDYTIAATESNRIQWMASQGALIIGTSGDEWVASSQSDEAPITPTNIRVRRQSRYGSAALPAQIVNDTAIFIQRTGLRVREFVYSFERDSFVSPELTLLAEHITEGGIVQTAFQRQKDAVLWCVTGDGRLIGMTYERDQGVVAWHQHSTDGEFESVAVIPGEAADEIWFSIKRTIDGDTVRYIERFDIPASCRDFSDQDTLVFLDSAKIVTNSPASTAVTGLDHLEGEDVDILADGAIQPARTVSGGSITLDTEASTVVVGLPYVSILQPMKTEVPLRDGTAQGRRFRCNRVSIRFYQTLGAEIIDDPDATTPRWEEIPFRDTSMAMDTAVPLATTERDVALESSYGSAINFAIRQTQPYPLNIIALILKFDVLGN